MPPWSGVFLVLMGLLVIFAGLWVEERFHSQAYYALVGLKFVEEFGIALFVVGAVGIILEFHDWRVYFGKRIEEIIVGQAYLRDRDKNALMTLERNALKAYFNTDEIDRKDSFLQFFHERIHRYIGSPYRENVRDVIHIHYSAGGNDQVEIDDTVSYLNRKVGDKYLDRVRWIETETTQITLLDYEVRIRVPHELFVSEEFNKEGLDAHGNLVFKKSEMPTVPGHLGFELTLPEKYACIDCLHVETHVRYTMPTTWLITWTMSHPSKGVAGTITYPSDLRLVANFFGMDADEAEVRDSLGSCQVGYDSWLMPDTGFAFQLIRPAPVATVPPPLQPPPGQNPPQEPSERQTPPALPTSAP
jgi:hypothetical protein